MKKLTSLLTLIALFGFTSTAFGQTELTESISSKVDIITAISTGGATNTNIDFGVVNPTGTYKMEADGTVDGGNSSSGFTKSAKIEVNGDFGANVEASITESEVELASEEGGSESGPTFTPALYGADADDPSSSAGGSEGATGTLADSDNDGDADYWYYVAGSLAANGIAGGTYTGDVTLNIEYTGL